MSDNGSQRTSSAVPRKDVALAVTAAVLSYICASVLARYLQWSPEPLVRLVAFFGLLLCVRYHVRRGLPPQIRPLEAIVLGIFALLLSLSIVLGFHIVIGNGFDGTLADNHITPYTPLDAVAFLLIFCAVMAFSTTAFCILRRVAGQGRLGTPPRTLEPLGPRWVLGLAALMFVLWAPYLLAYWPGLIFGDSLSSIRQALGTQEWSNHFPVAYTLLIKGCLSVASALGMDATAGCAVYSMLQMLLMALTFGYLCRWVTVRVQINGLWGIALAVVLGLMPHIATYSIAMWKDPLFSAALMLLSLLLMDLALSRGKVVRQHRSWLPLFALTMLATGLLRSNGVYVAALVCIALLAWFMLSRRHHDGAAPLKPLLCSLIAVAVTVAVTGPLYAAAGVRPTPRAESVGVMLNQMARVAATDGAMTEDDQAYMDSLLPLELYPEAYRPCLTDNLKAHDRFDADALEEGFFAHWLSMLWQNPRAYFEAWELQTCGFWTINQKAVLESNENVTGGLPRNLKPLGNEAGIHYENKLGSDELRAALLPLDEWAVPAGIINWGIAYLAVCLALLGRKRWLVALVPSLGLVLTLLLATPAFYWPRYEAACYFLVPFYVSMVLLLRAPGASWRPPRPKPATIGPVSLASLQWTKEPCSTGAAARGAFDDLASEEHHG